MNVASRLNEAEDRVARLIAQGMSNERIAEVLRIAPEDLDAQLATMYEKLGVSCRIELILLYHSTTGKKASCLRDGVHPKRRL